MKLSVSNKFLVAFTQLLSGSAISQLMISIVVLWISRIYSPEEFGLFTFATTLITIIGSSLGLRYENAIILPQEKQMAKQVFALALKIATGSILIIIPVLFFYFGKRYDSLDISLLIAGVFSYYLFLLFNQWMIRNSFFKQISISKTVQGIGFGFIVSISLLFSQNYKWLVLAYVFSFIFAIFSVIKYFPVMNSVISIPNKELKQVFRKFIAFPKYNLPHSVMSLASAQIPIFVLGIYSTEYYIGQYGLVFRLLFTPISLITLALSQVFLKRFSEIRNSSNLLRKEYNRTLKVGIFILLPMALIGYFISKDVLTFISGKQWAVAGEFSRYLIFWFLSILMVSHLNNLFIIKSGQKTALIIELVFFIIKSAGFIFGLYFLGELEAIIILSILGVTQQLTILLIIKKMLKHG